MVMPLPQTPRLSVDCVVVDAARGVLMVRRKFPPFKGELVLPGGFVEIGETVEDAARRELKEETGVAAGKLTLVGVYSKPDRDPRGHTCTIAFLTRVEDATAEAGDDAAEVAWVKAFDGIAIGFDHRKIIDDALNLSR
jgi:8-oxo-dGTP diphosphatase